MPEKREPEFTAPKPVAMMPKPVETLPKGLKIERPDEPVDESPADDDLEIPAFLRRRAK